MEKIKNPITLDHIVTFPLKEMEDYTVGVHIVFDLRGRKLAKGKSEEQIRKDFESTVFSRIPEVMAEYIAICLAIGSEDGENPNFLESKLLAHLKELEEISESALEEEMKKQKTSETNNQ